MAAGGRWKGWSGSFDFPKRHGALPSIKKHLMGFSLDKNGLDAKHSIKINVHSEHHCHVVLSIGTSLLFSAGNQFHLLLLFFHSHGNCESPCATFQAPRASPVQASCLWSPLLQPFLRSTAAGVCTRAAWWPGKSLMSSYCLEDKS